MLLGWQYLFLLIANSEGVIIDRCDLADQLLSFGFPKDQLGDWLCLVRGESEFNTSALSPPEYDGVRDYGLFQINGRYWCGPTGKNVCKLGCNRLLDEDLRDDVECVKKIFRIHGFSAWVAWVKNCKNKDVNKDLIGCKVDNLA